MKLGFGQRGVSGVLMLSLVSFGLAQGPASTKSPKEVLQAYRRMDAQGERLTAGGWHRAFPFFVKPAQPPRQKVVAVMGSERIDNAPHIEGHRVEFSVPCWAIGQIDSAGRFTSTVAPSLIDNSGHLTRQPVALVRGPAAVIRGYELILTDTHWELSSGREALREVKGPPEWRIETFEFQPWITVEAAITYLEGLRDTSSSERVRSNAEKSIARLRRQIARPEAKLPKKPRQ